MDVMTIIIAAISVIAGLGGGFFFGKSLLQKNMGSELERAKSDAKRLVDEAQKDAEALKKEKLLEAKEKAIQLQAETEREILKKTKAIEEAERSYKQKENTINQKQNTVKQKEEEFEKQKTELEKQKSELGKEKEKLTKELGAIDARKAEYDEKMDRLNKKEAEIQAKLDSTEKVLLDKLEKVAGLTQEEAKNQLIETMRKKAESDGMSMVKNIIDEANLKATKEAKKIIIQTIQRTAAESSIENTVSVFNLESDDVKGQIIGREGRNIRALEAATGVEFIVDDTPEAIVISGYDAYRREIARLSLQRLVADGRIHPARIEEVVAKTKKQLEQQIIEIGERTVIELNIQGLHPELIKLVGKMRYRSSYGQNLLQHSKETANLCATMAAELGLNVKLAKRAGLLHDIGKVSDEDPELSHALLGMKLAEKYKENPAVVNAIGAHHDEVEMTFVISPIIQACDAISGSRPGARREILEQYLKRIKELETLAQSYKGVEKAFAIQAGRELRVIVESEKVTDDRADELSFEIAQKIQNEMQYPGQIKVTVIREKRAVNYAK